MTVDTRAVGSVDSSDAALFDRATSLPRWFSASALRPIKEVNLQMLTLMRQHCPLLPVAESIADPLRVLPEEALDRIASTPCLLVSAGFHDDRRWRIAKQIAAASRSANGIGRDGAPAVVGLARATLFVAWHFVRTYPEAAEIVIGTYPISTQVLLELTLDELDQLACAHVDWIAPRWAQCPAHWEQLMCASRANIAPFTPQSKGLQLVLGHRWRDFPKSATNLASF